MVGLGLVSTCVVREEQERPTFQSMLHESRIIFWGVLGNETAVFLEMNMGGGVVFGQSSCTRRAGVASCVYFLEMEVMYAVEIGEFMAIRRCTSRMGVLHCLNF
jgi:hypothetical protein